MRQVADGVSDAANGPERSRHEITAFQRFGGGLHDFPNGRILMQNKKLLTLDRDKVIQNARDHIVGLLERADISIRPKWPVID